MSNITLKDIKIKGKIFCVSMQRSGTTSVGKFLEQWLNHVTNPMNREQRWPRKWFDGNFEAIINDPVFQKGEVFEDAPFWFPEFYKYLYHRVPGSRFILLHRDSDSWFKSMVRHSHGYAPGVTDIHAKVYRREDGFEWLQQNIPGFENFPVKAMTLFDQADKYKKAYERHTREVEKFFALHDPDALFSAKLSDPDVWTNLSDWLNLPKQGGKSMHSHAHKAKSEFTRDNLLPQLQKSGPKR